jgi:hypothetical protein
VLDLPAPGGPITKTQCLISRSSPNWTIFKMKSGSLLREASLTHASMMVSNLISLVLGTLIPGKRSPKRPKKISLSSATIFGMLKSLKALNRIAPSYRSGSALFITPATTNTDLIALRPQS